MLSDSHFLTAYEPEEEPKMPVAKIVAPDDSRSLNKSVQSCVIGFNHDIFGSNQYPMKKVRRRHPPAGSLIIKGNKRGEEEILDKGMTRNKKRKRVKKQKNRQEKTEEEPKMPVAKIVAPDDSSNKRCAEEIDENQLVIRK